KLAAWLQKQAVERVHACMEATGTYGEELAIFLSSQGHKVSIVNPACIKAYGESKLTRNKTDKSDAHLIARYCESEKPEAWIAPAAEARRLQAMVRHLDALGEMRQQEINRLSSGISVERASVISKIGNARIRKALYFPAMAAKRFNPIISAFCKRLQQRGKTKMAIIGAAMRKLLHQVFGVLNSGKAFDPDYAAK